MLTKEKKGSGLKIRYKTTVDSLVQWYNRDDNCLRTVRFPGTDLSLLTVVIDFIKLFTKSRTIDRAAAVAFNFIVALFPLILFFFTLIPYIPIPHLYERVMMLINDFLIPSGTLDFVTATIDGIMNQPHDGLLSLSIFLCLVFGSGGIVAFFNGFRNVYANYLTDKTMSLKDWLVQYGFAIIMLILIGALIMLAVLMIAMGGTTLKFLVARHIIEGGTFTFFIFNVLRWIIGVFALVLGISLLYYFGNVRFNEHYRREIHNTNDGVKKYRNFVIFSPGTILATILFVFGTMGFNVYISNFSRYNVLYGSIGTLIIIMLWIWIIAILILAGNDLNSGIRREVMKRSDNEDDMRRKQLVVDDLKKHIQTYQKVNLHRRKRIDELKKNIHEKQTIVRDLEELSRDYDLIVKAYEEYAEIERKTH